MKKTVGFLMLFNWLFCTGQNNSVDTYSIYPGYSLEDHIFDVLNQVNQDHLTYTKSTVYPSLDDNLLDSNLYSIIWIHLPGYDEAYARGPYLTATFYKNRIVCLGYYQDFKEEADAQKVIDVLWKTFGKCSDSLANSGYGNGKYNPIEMWYFDQWFQWSGKEYKIECAYQYKDAYRPSIQIVKFNTNLFEEYTSTRLLADYDFKKGTFKDISISTKVIDNTDLIKTMVLAVLNTKSLSSFEKTIPSSKRWGHTSFKKERDENGVFWGKYDASKKSYFYFGYRPKTEKSYSETSLFREIVVYTDLRKRIFSIKVYFNYNRYIRPLVKDVEKILVDIEMVPNGKSDEATYYKDMMDQINIYIHADQQGGVESIIIDQKNLENFIKYK